MIRTLRRKFVLITMALVSLVLLAVFFGIWLYNKTNMERQSYLALQMAVERRGGGEAWFEVGGGVPDGFRRDPTFVVSVEANGRTALLSSDRVNVGGRDLKETVTAALESGDTRGELAEYDLRFLMRPEGGGTTLIAFAPLSLERRMMSDVVLITGVFVAAAFFVFLGASMLLARWALKPVEQSWEQQNRFVADASHELKTPLAVIMANTGILQKDPDTTSEQRNWLNSTEKSAQRMKSLVDDMLFLAGRDDGSPPVRMASANLSAIVETSALAFESMAFERGLSLNVTVDPDLRLHCDEGLMRQLVGILVDNAVKYARDGSEVQVRLLGRQGHTLLSVFNESEPLTEEQRGHLFDRFYRLDQARTTEGSGLGLSIAQAIVQEHKGKLSVQNSPAGVTFLAEFPA